MAAEDMYVDNCQLESFARAKETACSGVAIELKRVLKI